MRNLELTEHGPGLPIDGLTVAAQQALKAVMSVSAAGADRWMLTPNRKVGVIRIGDLTVRITPKVSTAHLLFLMGYMKKAPEWQESLANVLEAGDLVATVSDAYSRLAERALLGGVLQAYRPVEATLPVLKGRLRVAAQLQARSGTIFPLEVRYQKFGLDTAENRTLKAAAQQSLRLPRLRPETTRRLLWIVRRLAEVSALAPNSPERWQPTRLNTRYRTALGLAELVLRGSSFDLPTGRARAEGFMLDMHVVFENFLCTALAEALSPKLPGEGRYPHPGFLDLGEALPMKPDFIWLTGGRPTQVVDAKYKADGKHKPHDVYQMLAYCSALGLPSGHLVYVSDQDVAPMVHEVRSSGVRIVRHTLNLALPPPKLLASIDKLAAHIAAEPGAVTGQ